jgi:hypothetical protein
MQRHAMIRSSKLAKKNCRSYWCIFNVLDILSGNISFEFGSGYLYTEFLQYCSVSAVKFRECSCNRPRPVSYT